MALNLKDEMKARALYLFACLLGCRAAPDPSPAPSDFDGQQIVQDAVELGRNIEKVKQSSQELDQVERDLERIERQTDRTKRELADLGRVAVFIDCMEQSGMTFDKEGRGAQRLERTLIRGGNAATDGCRTRVAQMSDNEIIDEAQHLAKRDSP